MDSTGDVAECDVLYEGTFEKQTYVDLLLVPIYVIVGITYLLTIIITLLRLLLWGKGWNFARKFREADRKMIAYMLEGFFNMLHHREGIRELENEIDGQHMEHPTEKKIEMTEKGTAHAMAKLDSNKEISHSAMIDTDEILRSKWAMTILSWYVGNVTSLALVVFWDVFIVNEKRTGCDDEFDCFYKNGTFISQLCRCLSNEDYFEATCYEVSLEFPKAIAEVAGILFLAFNGFAFLMFLILLVADGVASICLRIVTYLLLGAIEYLVVFGIIGAFVARGAKLGKEDSTNVIIEETLISFAMVMGVTAPWIILLQVNKNLL